MNAQAVRPHLCCTAGCAGCPARGKCPLSPPAAHGRGLRVGRGWKGLGLCMPVTEGHAAAAGGACQGQQACLALEHSHTPQQTHPTQFTLVAPRLLRGVEGHLHPAGAHADGGCTDGLLVRLRGGGARGAGEQGESPGAPGALAYCGCGGARSVEGPPTRRPLLMSERLATHCQDGHRRLGGPQPLVLQRRLQGGGGQAGGQQAQHAAPAQLLLRQAKSGRPSAALLQPMHSLRQRMQPCLLGRECINLFVKKHNIMHGSPHSGSQPQGCQPAAEAATAAGTAAAAPPL